jgi:hypothetical protein
MASIRGRGVIEGETMSLTGVGFGATPSRRARHRVGGQDLGVVRPLVA